MGHQNPLTPNEQADLDQISQLIEEELPSRWEMDNEYAIQYAQELIKGRPPKALAKARKIRKELEDFNRDEDKETAKAQARQVELAQTSVYSMGPPGLVDTFLRSFIAGINGTPRSGLNRMELNDKGLFVYTPLTTVTERTITPQDIDQRRFELGVNPPAYFDAILGQLKSLGIKEIWTPWGKFKVRAPWGQITMREPGSGNVLAEVIAFWPNDKLDEFRKGLQQLYRADHPFEKHKRLPKLSDLFNLYVDEWEQFIPPLGYPAILSISLGETVVGRTYTYKIESTGDPPLTYKLINPPKGMTIDANSGDIAWTPKKDGKYRVRVEVSNSIGKDIEEFPLKVAKDPNALATPTGCSARAVGRSCLFLLLAGVITLLAIALQPLLQ